MPENHTSQLRAGETVTDQPARDDASLQFIGSIRTPWSRLEDCPRRGDPEAGPDCSLDILPQWRPALAGLERFESADVLYWLHWSRRDLTRQSPRSDGRTTGTFSVRSPLRPNPIGLTRVRVLEVAPDHVLVRGLDCLNGTPLLDIKPSHCMFSGHADAPPPAR